MKPVDKFGNPIYSKTYETMLGFGRLLTKHGYVESFKKPNLFYRKAEDGTVYFADMRGTDIVAIWEDPSPLFYWKFPEHVPEWKQRRLIKRELEELPILRLSFYEECEPDGLMFGEAGDGYCLVCGKDFQDEGNFCSALCKEAFADLGKDVCRVCGKLMDYGEAIRHHLEYADEKTIIVCRSCHSKIHRGSKLPKLKPLDSREKECLK